MTIRVHDADDHLFFPGAGPSTPADHQVAHHVDPAVVADIAHWLTTAGRQDHWSRVERHARSGHRPPRRASGAPARHRVRRGGG